MGDFSPDFSSDFNLGTGGGGGSRRNALRGYVVFFGAAGALWWFLGLMGGR